MYKKKPQKNFWVDILQLIRTVSQETELQKLKNKVSSLETFPESWALKDQVFFSHFVRRCCLRAEFYGLGDNSIMESFMLRSGALLQRQEDSCELKASLRYIVGQPRDTSYCKQTKNPT